MHICFLNTIIFAWHIRDSIIALKANIPYIQIYISKTSNDDIEYGNALGALNVMPKANKLLSHMIWLPGLTKNAIS